MIVVVIAYGSIIIYNYFSKFNRIIFYFQTLQSRVHIIYNSTDRTSSGGDWTIALQVAQVGATDKEGPKYIDKLMQSPTEFL